jgi:hypothetical protein
MSDRNARQTIAGQAPSGFSIVEEIAACGEHGSAATVRGGVSLPMHRVR